MKRSVLLCFLLQASVCLAQWAPAPVVPEYRWAGGVLAVVNFKVYDGAVPGGRHLNFNRNDLWLNSEPGSLTAVWSTAMNVDGDGAVYDTSSFIVNRGGATAVADSRRLLCTETATGYCIGHDTAITSLTPRVDRAGIWGERILIGAGVAAARRIEPDTAFSPVSDPDYIDDIDGRVNVRYAVTRWMVGQSSGDFFQIEQDGVGVVARMTKDGVLHATAIYVGGIPLNEYIARVVRAQVAGRQ